jgi:hypothetical protein
MANTGKTRYTGTVVEVRKKGDVAWEKFLCNKNAIEIDFGTNDESTDVCLEAGVEDVTLGVNKFGDQTFEYTWTQASTNAADAIILAAKIATNGTDKEVEFRITMDNATGAEALGTTYIIPFAVKGYKHKGEDGGKWLSETTVRQIGIPVETAAA